MSLVYFHFLHLPSLLEKCVIIVRESHSYPKMLYPKIHVSHMGISFEMGPYIVLRACRIGRLNGKVLEISL